jgi:hypothetical protein
VGRGEKEPFFFLLLLLEEILSGCVQHPSKPPVIQPTGYGNPFASYFLQSIFVLAPKERAKWLFPDFNCGGVCGPASRADGSCNNWKENTFSFFFSHVDYKHQLLFKPPPEKKEEVKQNNWRLL